MNEFSPTDFIELRKVLINQGYSDYDVSNYEREVLEPIRDQIRDHGIDQRRINILIKIWVEGSLRYKEHRPPGGAAIDPKEIMHFIYAEPIERMPLFINEIGVYRVLSKWRLRIGK